MANPKKRVPENVPGDFFVDSTCIDCDACRQIAPAFFGEAAETSFVKAQPVSSAARRQAVQALLACPTGSIGCLGDDDVKAVMKDFPLILEEPVFYCGYNSPRSYGGNSYFIRHAAGNWLIDAPKFVTPLVQQLEGLGGIYRFEWVLPGHGQKVHLPVAEMREHILRLAESMERRSKL
jgi:ferredoxin